MSDAYAKEFEKWLKESKENAINEDETEDEEYDKEEELFDESDTDNDSLVGTNDSYNEEDTSQKNSLMKKDNKIMLSSVNDSAPILVDDDDDDDDLFPTQKEHFEDEPPVLEPVPKHVGGSKIHNRGRPKFSPQNSLRNYSRHRQTYARKSLVEEQKGSIKTYSNRVKRQSFAFDNYEEPSHSLKSKDSKESENIFDKFRSISENFEDAPPPLIPSPEALHLNTESPVDIKHPSHSPDFCAMEADSTSEISGTLACNIFGSRRLSKNSFHGDVSIECDSTCMLGASPIIVSPASISNGEMEEARDPGGGGGGNREKETKTDNSKKLEGGTEEKQVKSPEELAVSFRTSNFDTLMGNNTYSINEEAELLAKESNCTSLDLSAEGKICDVFGAFPDAVKRENESDSACGFPNEPPILSVISPAHRPHHRSRRKRHSIDNPETCSKLAKRSHDVGCPHNTEHLLPPTLTHVSETVIALNSRSKRSKPVTHHSKKGCLCCIQENCLQRKGRHQRCNTLPFSNVSEEHSKHLPKDLYNFVVNAKELSQLQSRMHKLLYQLFPQLRSELDVMSPESFRFERMLCDLIKALEQPNTPREGENNLSLHSHNRDRRSKISMTECERTNSLPLKPVYGPQSTLLKSLSSMPPCKNHLVAAATKTDGLKSDVLCWQSPAIRLSNHENLSRQATFKKTPERGVEDLKESDLLAPQLSRLTIKDIEDNLRPFQVLLHGDPEIVLVRFSQLSCSALQLLLPDLAISLCSELAQSPGDLIVFIDNVILTNSNRQKSKH